MNDLNQKYRRLVAMYNALRAKYAKLVQSTNNVVRAYNKNMGAFRRLFGSYFRLKKNYIILRRHSTRTVTELIDRINNEKYQIVFDEYRRLVKASEAFLKEVEMDEQEFARSFYVDVMFEKYLPVPDRASDAVPVPRFHFPVMVKSWSSDADLIHPFAHFGVSGKCAREKPGGRWLYLLNAENITSAVELDYFQKTDTLIRSLSMSNFSLMSAKKTIEMHKVMLISLTCSLIGEYSSETSLHLKNMQNLCSCLSRECLRMGLLKVENYDPEEYVKDINYTSVLHDIGKMAVPSAILCKDSALSDDENAVVRRHPEIGASYIKRVMDLFQADPMYAAYCSFLAIPHGICRSHHERWDGSGYPDGLAGEAIPFPARVVSVVDTYEAIRGQRAYNKPARKHEEAVEIITGEAGRQFDPRVVEAFLRVEYQFREVYADMIPEEFAEA